jgi:hypothetical protein
MNRIARGVLVAGVVASIAAGGAQAQARGYFGFGAGASVPTGDFGDGYKVGWIAQVVAGITGPTGVIGGRVNGSITRHNHDTLNDNTAKLVGAMGDLVFSPGGADSKVRPYLLGGIGFQNVKLEAGQLENSVTELAYNFGAGITVALSKAKLFVEGRWLSVQTDPSSTNLIPISIGLRFGGN